MRTLISFGILFLLCSVINAEEVSGIKEYNQGRAYYEVQQDFEKARIEFEKVVNNYPGSPLEVYAMSKIAWCYFEEKKYDSAIVWFKKVVEKYPDTGISDDAQYQIGYILFKQGKYDSAIKEFKKVIENYGDKEDKLKKDRCPFAQYMLGESYEKMGKVEEARMAYLEVIAKYPKSSEARRALKKLEELLK